MFSLIDLFVFLTMIAFYLKIKRSFLCIISIFFILNHSISDIIYIPPNSSFFNNSKIFYKSSKSVVGTIIMLAISHNKLYRLKSGEYNANNIIQFAIHLTSHKFYMRKITIPEGYSSFKICQILNSNKYLSNEIKLIPKEGSISPGTYLYTRNYDRNELIAKMQDDFIHLTNKIWNNTSNKYWKTKQDWIIFSSIVQSESGNDEEMHEIASILRNRLDKKMGLYACTTAAYGITLGKWHINKLSYKDIQNKSQYNTYKVNGLPIGPITNPGKNALIASINPKKTNKLFFHHKNNKLTTSTNINEHINSMQNEKSK